MSEEIVALQRQVTGLSRLHLLQKQLRESQSAAQIGFMMVNDTQQLVPYRQAVWWQPAKGVSHASGLVNVEKNAPYIRWCHALCQQLQGDQVQSVSVESLDAKTAAQWDQFMPAFVLAVPVLLGDGKQRGWLLLGRDSAFAEHETGLLSELSDIYRFALRGQRKRPRKTLSRGRKWLWQGLAAALVLVSLIPIRLSVLAPAEVVAKNAQPVRAPYEGVIDQLHVRPNQSVKAGELLVSLDSTDLKNRLQIAQQALQIANTEFRQVAQQAVFDEKGKLELAIRRGMVEKSVSELKYLRALLQRTEVRASADGIVVLSDASEWIGRPVALGEQIMTLADPAQAELRIDLPVRDAIPLESGADVRFFMNISPDEPLNAQLEWLAYKADESDEGLLAYGGRAAFSDDTSKPRIGLRGTARLYGDRAPVAYYLFRRPLAAARQWLGF